MALRRPGRTGGATTGRGVLSMQGLSYGVVRVDSENSLTSLTLQVGNKLVDKLELKITFIATRMLVKLCLER